MKKLSRHPNHPVSFCIVLMFAALSSLATRAAVTEAWVQRYNGPANGNDYATAVAVDSSGNVIVTGFSENRTNSEVEGYTAKYAAADGALLWERRYNSPSNTFFHTSTMAV